MTDEAYAALIGDIRGSRQLEDREEVQRELREALAEVNRILADGLAAELVITTGDEFQGLFATPSQAIEAMGRVDERFPALSFSFGLGWGGLSTQLEPQAVGMDGLCFHTARAALEHAHGGPGTALRGLGDAIDAHATSVLALVQAARSDWTQTQCRYALALRDAPTQQAIADRFERSKSSVSESLTAAHARQVHEAEASLGTLLDRQARDGEEATAP